MTEAFNGAAEAINASGKQLEWVSSRYDKLTNAISSMVNLAKDTTEAFGGVFSDELQAGIDGFIKGMGLVSSAISAATAAKEAYAAATISAAGAEATFMSIAWPMLVAAAAIAGAVAIFQANVSRLKKTIDEQKDAIEDLQRDYDELKDAMEKSLSNSQALAYHEEMVQNLKRQMEELEEAIVAAEKVAQKNPSDENKSAVKDLKQDLEDLNKKIAESEDDWIEFMGLSSDWRSMQDDWASGWLSAFRETGDGLSALKEDFDSLLDGIIAKMVSGAVFEDWTANFKSAMSRILSDGEITLAERQELQSYRNQLNQLNQEAKTMMSELGFGKSAALDNDTLQRGIESITEQTAQALEALLNSTRAAVWENNTILRTLADFSMNEGDNTIMAQMRAQTEYLRSIATVAEAVYFPGSHAKGSGGIKVFID